MKDETEKTAEAAKLRILALVYGVTDCSNGVHDFAMLHHTQRRIADGLVASGHMIAEDGLALCDGDGFTVCPERYGRGYQLTLAGYEALTGWNPERYPIECRRFAALAAYRDKQGEPDPHDPLGDGSVTLWSLGEPQATCGCAGAIVKVDGIAAIYLSHAGEERTPPLEVNRHTTKCKAWNPTHRSFDFAALRDKVRAERSASTDAAKEETGEAYTGEYIADRLRELYHITDAKEYSDTCGKIGKAIDAMCTR